ncbi:uncharacterized protein LOC103317721 [Nasonia vitripennis]|uniref:Uncharacterized protein n=1 Tax=Nasonia vitripennis TaxID=7425 RepID=A0A7M7Q2C6_NASVI|nr:uncharacterized protein LOC103317721 [Nasonia vitripennis]XP_031780727.1 uncharacterized protein LOC103317721 [Nasonia vitripennis]XP_031780732.1 uncharacterized protein LOC103317721 [Nasonia vitripennis]
MRRSYRKVGVRKKKNMSIPSKGKLMKSEEDNEEIKESVDWLAANEVPWDLVLSHWKKNYKNPLQRIKRRTKQKLKAWDTFFDIVKIKINERDGTAVTLNQKLSHAENSDSKVLLGLALICHMYPAKQMKQIQGKAHRPSIGLSKESMFKIAETLEIYNALKRLLKQRQLHKSYLFNPIF